MDREKEETMAETIRDVTLWNASFEDVIFLQEAKQVPTYFVITSDHSVKLRNRKTGASLNALPGSMWKCVGIESVVNEPLCFSVELSNSLYCKGVGGNTVSGWVFWDRRPWVKEVERLGLIPGKESKTRKREFATAMVRTSLQTAQDANVWSKMPIVAPVHYFDSTVRNIAIVKSCVPLRPRSGPTWAECAKLSAAPYKIGESVLTRGKMILDGGWTFYQIKKRHYGTEQEAEAHGWFCTHEKDYVTKTLKD